MFDGWMVVVMVTMTKNDDERMRRGKTMVMTTMTRMVPTMVMAMTMKIVLLLVVLLEMSYW